MPFRYKKRLNIEGIKWVSKILTLGEDFDFEQMLNESFENAENNSVVDGVIVEISGDRVLS